MLRITIPETEIYNEKTNEFIPIKEQTLQLEHSLVSLSKWESKWCKPFISTKDKTDEETIDYVRCMTMTQNVNPNVYLGLSSENIKQVNDYIAAPMTATTIHDRSPGRVNKETITSEILYYRMLEFGIPFECQKWHLNRLITLIKVCDIKNGPQQKMPMSEVMRQQAAINAANRKRFNSKG